MENQTKNNISYSAVVLDERSRERLLNKFKDQIPEGWEVVANHMTINLGEIDPQYEKYLSMPVRIQVEDFAIDDKVVAVGVSGFPSKNAKPHITLAVNRKAGGKPKMSNDLKDWQPLKRPLLLVGKVEEIPFNF